MPPAIPIRADGGTDRKSSHTPHHTSQPPSSAPPPTTHRARFTRIEEKLKRNTNMVSHVFGRVRVRTKVYQGYLLGKSFTEVFSTVWYGFNTLPNPPAWFGTNSTYPGSRHSGKFGTPTKNTKIPRVGVPVYSVYIPYVPKIKLFLQPQVSCAKSLSSYYF